MMPRRQGIMDLMSRRQLQGCTTITARSSTAVTRFKYLDAPASEHYALEKTDCFHDPADRSRSMA
jgi:hypothetical protein